MRWRLVLRPAAIAVGCALGWLASSGRLGDVSAQDARAVPDDEGTPKVLPRPDFQFKGKVGKTYKDSDPPRFPRPVQAPKGAPNVVLILLDDTGFGQYSTFGGGVPDSATIASTPRPCAARRGPRSSPGATTTPPRPASSPRRQPATTATPASCLDVAAPSARSSARTGP